MKKHPAADTEAPLRGGLLVIDGETLLPKLSDDPGAAPNFAIIAGHRAKVPLPHARRHGSSPDGRIPGGHPGLKVFNIAAINWDVSCRAR